jgi:hypothetical protein
MNHGGPHRDVFRSIDVKKIAICEQQSLLANSQGYLRIADDHDDSAQDKIADCEAVLADVFSMLRS